MGRDFEQKQERVKSFTNKIRTNLESDCHDGFFKAKAKKNDKQKHLIIHYLFL